MFRADPDPTIFCKPDPDPTNFLKLDPDPLTTTRVEIGLDNPRLNVYKHLHISIEYSV